MYAGIQHFWAYWLRTLILSFEKLIKINFLPLFIMLGYMDIFVGINAG